jgi:DNA-binding transcriptional LysR family regulator
MDRLESMSILVTAVDAGSLSAASRRLGIPLATVSRKVSELEVHLNTRLLTRSGRRLVLTNAGRDYVAACQRILEEVEEAERTATGEYRTPKGELNITTPIVFGRLHVMPIVIDFLKTYPEIDIRMVLTDRIVNLLEEHIDVAVRIGELPDSSLIAIRVGSIRPVVCASPGYYAVRGTPKHPADLNVHDCISFDGLASYDSWRFRVHKAHASVAIHSRLVVSTAETAIDAAIAGLGITRVLSYQVADAIRAGTLVTALREFEPPPWPVSLVFAEKRFVPQKLRALLDFAAPRLKAGLCAITADEPFSCDRIPGAGLD